MNYSWFGLVFKQQYARNFYSSLIFSSSSVHGRSYIMDLKKILPLSAKKKLGKLIQADPFWKPSKIIFSVSLWEGGHFGRICFFCHGSHHHFDDITKKNKFNNPIIICYTVRAKQMMSKTLPSFVTHFFFSDMNYPRLVELVCFSCL